MNSAKADKPTRKIGEGHFAAMGRQGLKELRGAMYTQSNVAQHPEYGLFGTETPGEIAEAREGEAERDQERGGALDQRLKQAEQSRDASSRDSKAFTKE